MSDSGSIEPVIGALDIGGSKLSFALVKDVQILERHEVQTPTDDRGPQRITQAVLGLIQPHLPACSSLGVAATGVVANGCVTALNSDTLQGWHAYDLRDALQQASRLEVTVLNDADAAAYGEYAHGSGQGTQDFAFLTVSTGIGGGLVLGGQLHLTTHGLQSELGYTLDPNDQPLELIASGAALDRWANARGWPNARTVVREALAGDADANAILEHSAGLIARKLADLRVILGISRAAIGGGLGLSQGYLTRVQTQLERLGEPWNTLEVVPASLGIDAGLVGAAAWAKRKPSKDKQPL